MSHTRTSTFVTTAIAFVLMLLIATPVFAAGNSSGKKKRNVDMTCMQTAVMVREDAVIAAWGTFSTSITTALTARKTALNTAWASTTSTSTEGTLKTQRLSAWAKWKKASHDAHVALKKARKAAWNTFRSTTKNSCSTSAASEEKLGSDATGEVAL